MNGVDLSKISGYANAYSSTISGILYKELKLAAEGINVIENLQDEMLMPKLSVKKASRPYDGVFAPDPNQFEFSDRKLRVDLAQRDLYLTTTEFRTTYLAKWAASYGSNSDKEKQIPLPAFFWGEYMKNIASEVVGMVYNGLGVDKFATFASGTSYSVGALVKITTTNTGKSRLDYFKCITATTAGQSPITHPAKWENVNDLAITEGFEQKFLKAIADEGFDSIVSTGDITVDDALDQFKAIFRGLSEVQRNKGAVIYTSLSDKDTLVDCIDNKYKGFQRNDNVFLLPGTDGKCKVLAVDWLAGKKRKICSLPNNLTVGTNKLSDMNKLFSKVEHYGIETSLTYLFGTEICDLESVVINDQP